MLRCKIVHFLFSLFPLKIWQNFLIGFHVEKCEACRRELAGQDEIKALLYQESDVEDFREIWPDVKEKIVVSVGKRKALFSTRLNRAVATGSLMILILAGALFYSVHIRGGGSAEQSPGNNFRINSIRVGDEPATPFLYQPQDSDMIIVWAEKSS